MCFHAGDAVALWGITPDGFSLSWQDGQGAPGFTGLTLHVAAPGKPTASLTLAGYTTADLNNGRLSISFGEDAASGSSYMHVLGTASLEQIALDWNCLQFQERVTTFPSRPRDGILICSQTQS